ncbi:MAG: hypothetical protein EA362_08425 [Saprospirales bacterium]|nr:MAG: hypothetical protein EA362_08425 [Saprospirales bacterium]
MKTGELIGSGKYRNCFSIEGSHLCAKKKRPFHFKLKNLRPGFFRDLNKEEFHVYSNLPPKLKEFFPPNYQIVGELLISERPRDYSGEYSKIIQEHGPVENASFWEDIDTIFHLLIEHKIWLFDVFNKGTNIIVQKVSENVFRPVIIDCKKFGLKSYPLQIHLWLESERRKKLIRRLSYFHQRFKPDSLMVKPKK